MVNIALRTVSGNYIIGSGTEISNTISKKEILASGVGMTCVRSNGWGVINNTPCSGFVQVQGSFN